MLFRISVCNSTAKHTAMPIGKTDASFSFAFFLLLFLNGPKNRLTHSNLALHCYSEALLRQVECAVCIPEFASPENAGGEGARQSDQNEVISTSPMASQQLTTMPMIHTRVEILLVVKPEKGRWHLLNTSCTSKQMGWMRTGCTFCSHPYRFLKNIGAATEVSITEELLNQLKNEEWLYELA